jgi:hypothetical protein
MDLRTGLEAVENRKVEYCISNMCLVQLCVPTRNSFKIKSEKNNLSLFQSPKPIPRSTVMIS